MNIFAKAPGLMAQGLRSLSTQADKIKPGEILRSGAQRLEAISPESYNQRLAELRALESKVANLATATVAESPATTVTQVTE